ncbi:MAG: alpha/beta fold hydrolase [Candidatus Dormibacterales bacterium]
MDFDSDGVRLHYEVHGAQDGPPVVLVHGFASSYRLNWVGTRWQETLTSAGFRVVGLDCRGHGHSDKPHDPTAYSLEILAADVSRLLDQLKLAKASYVGYSMGARIGLRFLIDAPNRVDRAVLGGIGTANAIEGADAVADALVKGEPADDGVARTFYRFAAASPSNDLLALAACFRGIHGEESPSRLAGIRTPTLIVIGDRDEIAGSGADLTEMIPTARLLTIPGRDHLGAVPAREFKRAAVEFLSAD